MENHTPTNGQSDATVPDNENANTVGAAVEAIASGGASIETPPAPTTTPSPGDNKGVTPTPSDDQPPARLPIPDGTQEGAKIYRAATGWRDYSGLSPSEVDIFQKMGNRAYNTLYPIYMESRKWNTEKETLKKELEALRGASFYENENAYRVTDEYQQLEQVVNSLSGEQSFWQSQLAAIEGGQPYSVLVQDGKGGVAVQGPITEYNQGEARAQILGALTKANAMVQQYSGQLASYGQSYKGKYEGAKKTLADTEARIFNGADMKKLDQAADMKIKMFPPEIRSVPVRTLARALVVIDGLIAMNKRTAGNGVSQRLKNNISQAAGPSNGQITTGATPGQTVGSVMEEFKRAKAMGHI